MNFLIADTFTDSLARLTGDEQKSVKTTVFDLQVDPSQPGHSFHKLDRAKDKNFWSVRVNRDARLIVHRTPRSFLVCYVAHHDNAYEWAERRKLERHPQTDESLLELVDHLPAEAAEALLELATGGTPSVAETPSKQTEPPPVEVTEPAIREREFADAGTQPLDTPVEPPVSAETDELADAFAHPDSQRRFHAVASAEELE